MSQDDKLPFREQLAYGAGDFACVLYWHTFSKYLPYYYTDVFGISAATLGGLLLFSRVFAGIDDPVVGLWADRTNTRFGKFRPFILFGALPFVVFGVLTFTTPNFAPTGKVVWAYVTYNCLMILYTVINIPYTAMLGVMTSDGAARTRLSSIKFVCAFSAGMVISATLLPLVRYLGDNGQNPQKGWQLAFILIGLVALVFFWITFAGTRERLAPATEQKNSVLADLRLLVTNGPWRLLLATTVSFILFVSLKSSVFAHYFKYYVLGGDTSREIPFFSIPLSFDGLVSTLNTAGQAASVVGVLITASQSHRLPKAKTFIACFSIAISATASYFFIPPSQVQYLFIAEIVGSMAASPIPVLLWAMYADTADYAEWKTGRRMTGLVFSASQMGQKISWAIGAYVAFQILSTVGFQANVTPSPAVRQSLGLLVSLAPASFGILSILIFLFYPLKDQRVAQIQAELAERRAQVNAASPATS